MPLEGVRIVHAIPGRIRLKVAGLRDEPRLAADVHDALSRIPDVERLEINTRTGSVIVFFEEPAASSAESVRALSETWPKTLSPLELGTFDPTHTEHTNGDAAPAVDRRLLEMLGSVNAGVGKVAAGIDLRLLVPLALFALGFRSLVFSDKVPAPTWYDFFWFGLGTFVMLNPSVETQAAQRPPLTSNS